MSIREWGGEGAGQPHTIAARDVRGRTDVEGREGGTNGREVRGREGGRHGEGAYVNHSKRRRIS